MTSFVSYAESRSKAKNINIKGELFRMEPVGGMRGEKGGDKIKVHCIHAIKRS
jgi:hypothetical protein